MRLAAKCIAARRRVLYDKKQSFRGSRNDKEGFMMYPAFYQIPAEELGKDSKVPILILADSGEVHFELALEMLDEIVKNNAAGRRTVFICPYGPIGQYHTFARLVNERRVSLKNVWIINMDEYLTDDGEWLPYEDPRSFRAGMDRELYSKIDPELVMPAEQRVFPDPHNPGAIQQLIDTLGGVDIVMGGIAVNGHIAFNEPEPEMTNEQFAQLPTRVEKLSQATLLKDAIMGRGGAIDTVPKQAVTVGMKEMLGARKLRLTMMADMQRAVIRRAGYGEVTASFPVSFAQTHPDAKIIISRNVAEKPF